MKKLMLLGGSRYILPIIKQAHDMGIHVITCDYLPNNVAHRYSDEYCNISIIDKEAVLRKCENLKIDGISSFACDPGVVTAAYVAEKMGLPSCGPYESVKILQNKALFRDFLRRNNFCVPFSKSFSSFEDIDKSLGDFRFPVIVKPVDSAGSKGVSCVEDCSSLQKAFQNAIEYSISKEVIIEEFIESDGYPSDSECFSLNGRMDFISFSAQHFDSSNTNPYVPCGFTWEPSIIPTNRQILSSELQRLIGLLHMQTSIYNVESRQGVDGKPYLMEVSPRGGGNRLAEMVKLASGLDLIQYAVQAAMGDVISEIPQVNIDETWAEIIVHSRESGIFRSLIVDESIKKYIVEKALWVNEGDCIDAFSGADKTLGSIVLKFDDTETMNRVMDKPNEFYQIMVD